MLDVGFWSDDYGLLGYAARLSPWNYLVFYFDPRLQTIWYRPLQGVELGVAYFLFRSDPLGYHVLQLLLHVTNCLLLFGLVSRLTPELAGRSARRSGFCDTSDLQPRGLLGDRRRAVVCRLLHPHAMVVDRLPGDRQAQVGGARIRRAPVRLAHQRSRRHHCPSVLFLADRWLVNKRESLVSLVRRYVPFVVILGIYGLVEYKVITQGVYTCDSGYGIGLHVIPIALEYLTRLTFPWGISPPLSYVWLAVVLIAAAILAFRREWRLLFIAAVGLLTVMPVMLFRQVLLRYMYLPLMATAAAYGIAGEYLLQRLERMEPYPLGPPWARPRLRWRSLSP